MSTEKVTIELGEKVRVSLPAGSGLKGGRWATTGNAAVIDSDDDPEASSVEIVGANVGRDNVSYVVPLVLSSQEAVAANLLGPAHREALQRENTHTVEVTVVGKGETKKLPGPLADSSIHTGLLPMDEVQDGPSERTPYGMDQFNRPVAPHPSMTAGADTTNVAKATEDATATGPKSVEEKTREAQEGSKKSGTSKKSGASKGDGRAKAAAKRAADRKTAAKKSAAKPGAKPSAKKGAAAKAGAKTGGAKGAVKTSAAAKKAAGKSGGKRRAKTAGDVPASTTPTGTVPVVDAGSEVVGKK